MANPTCVNQKIDYIDGYPSESGEYTVTIAEYGYNREDDPDPQALRDILGLPDDGAASDGTVTLLYKLGSGIRVPAGHSQFQIWKGHRLDCECLRLVCDDGSGTAPSVTSTMSCIADLFLEGGVYDPRPDKISITSKTILSENFCVGEGIRLDGQIPNLMTFNTEQADDPRFDGIPLEGSFTNFIDAYGIIHAAMWKIVDDQVDITFMTQDPRIPGVSSGDGHVAKVDRSLVVFKNGITTITRQIIKSTTSGLVILGQGHVQEEGQFQATFPCDTQPSDPFLYHIGCGVTDQVEFVNGTVIEQDPEDPTEEFVWWPTVIDGSSPGFTLYGPDLHPLTQIPVEQI